MSLTNHMSWIGGQIATEPKTETTIQREASEVVIIFDLGHNITLVLFKVKSLTSYL